MPPAAVIGGAALVGGVAGALGSRSSSETSSGVNAGSATAAENIGQQGMLDNFSTLQNYANAGPGQQDVQASTDASRSLAALLQRYSQGQGSLPSAQDISASNSSAQRLFGAQRVGLTQSFEDQTTAANRQAAMMGRSGDDPILRAKLATEQMRQSSMLDANQNSLAQQMALQMPGQRLGYATQNANVLGGLATQAMANRQALAAMGEGIMNNERNFRLQTATRWGTQSSQSGGGLGGAITGAIGGLSAGMGMIGGGGGGMPTGQNFSMPSTSSSSFFSQMNPYGMAGTGFATAPVNQYSLSGPASYGGVQPALFSGQFGGGNF